MYETVARKNAMAGSSSRANSEENLEEKKSTRTVDTNSGPADNRGARADVCTGPLPKRAAGDTVYVDPAFSKWYK